MSNPGENGDFQQPPMGDPGNLHGYRLGQLDRGAYVLESFNALDGKGPRVVLEELCLLRGTARVLSAGAGTGHQLHDWIQSARSYHLPGSRDWNIYGEAVSDYDFSAMSTFPGVAEAYQTNELTYTTARMEDYQSAQPFDIVTAYELLARSDRPQDIVLSLWRALGKNGIAYFNADFEQDAQIEEALRQVRQKRWDVTKREAETPLVEELALVGQQPRQRRMNYRIAPMSPGPGLEGIFAPLNQS